MKENRKHAGFSNFNDQVELSAPGKNIKSTRTSNKYGKSSGTSMAVPHISGIAGLIWMHFPFCTNHQIRNILAETAMDISAFKGCDKKTGFGFVQSMDAYNRLLSTGENCGGYKSRSSDPIGGCNLDSRQEDDEQKKRKYKKKIGHGKKKTERRRKIGMKKKEKKKKKDDSSKQTRRSEPKNNPTSSANIPHNQYRNNLRQKIIKREKVKGT